MLVCSTGVIGKRLPMINLTQGLRELVPALSADGGDAAAHAIMTTDTVATVRRPVRRLRGRRHGEGRGDDPPVLATMLAVITTDYALTREEADAILRPAVDATFNRISIDGDCSTNDAVILLANGASGVERTPARDAELAAAVRQVCGELAEMIVRDGEGATVLLQIDVTGAATEAEAIAIAQRVAISPLVKTAAFGHDPNWGRVLAAAGSAAWGDGFARLDPDRVTLAFNGTPVFVDGAPVDATPDLTGTLCRIELSLGLGEGSASYIASDLTYDYVRINAEYTT
ncbi:MAG: bifunctional ornithine acetyltransferase/N-acetylglutamate synthase [Thermoleophilia bacterium]